MAETVEQLQPQDRTEEQIAEDIEWLKSLRSGSKFRIADFDKKIGYEGKR